MSGSFVDRSVLLEFLVQLDETFFRPGRLYLIGETTQLLEGWRTWTDQIEFAAETAEEDRQAFGTAVQTVQNRLTIHVLEESPVDVIPLPVGYEQRARPIELPEVKGEGCLSLLHFDPYSVAFRFLARGDEQDYRTVLSYLEHEWVTVEEMDAKLGDLLPKFTSETIQQDPAEFRRKYKGLLQMWRAR